MLHDPTSYPLLHIHHPSSSRPFFAHLFTELGRSKSAKAPAAVGELAPAGFLKEVCEQLSLGPVVVISPSLSGMYSLPFLMEHQALIRAYIPIAPICTDKFTTEQYQSVKVCVQTHLCSELQYFCILTFFSTTCVFLISSLNENLSSCLTHFSAGFSVSV